MDTQNQSDQINEVSAGTQPMTKKERRRLRREEKNREREKTNSAKSRGSFKKIIIVLLVLGVLFFGIFKYFTTPSKEGEIASNALSTCVNHSGASALHIHPILSITANGEKQELEEGIGVSSFCMRPIHTHDSLGTLHVEFPRKHDFVLGDFFAKSPVAPNIIRVVGLSIFTSIYLIIIPSLLPLHARVILRAQEFHSSLDI